MIRRMKGLVKIGWILLLLLAGWQVGVAQDDTANDDFADPWDPWEEGETSNSLWTDIVTSRPNSYVETTSVDGKTIITLRDENALAWLASVAGGYNGATKSSFDNIEVILEADVDMSAHVWSGISEFGGLLNGQGNSIIGLRINDDTPNGYALIDTLFSSGEIRDLHLEETNIDVNAEKGVASFVAWNFGLLKGCSNSGFLQAYYPAGGLVGHNGGKILSCENLATVAAVGSVGGIANYNDNLIADCVNKGTLSSGNGCGGICNALEKGTIRNAMNKGSVSGKSSSGGLVAVCSSGDNYIVNSCNVANVVVPENIASAALLGSINEGVECSIINCYGAIVQPLLGSQVGVSDKINLQYLYFSSSNSMDKESQKDYIASFSSAEDSDGNDWTLSYEVYGKTDLVEALNAWVAEQDADVYSAWAEDVDMENNGYPVLTFTPWEDPSVELSTSLWTEVVTAKPDSYEETTNSLGKTIITLKDERALAWLASVAGGYNGASKSTFENTEVILSVSLDMSAYVWSCIPNFNGFFNGNKKSITGLRIANNTPNGFAMIATLGETGEIRNLNLKETDLNLTGVKGQAATLVCVNYGLIQGCSASGDMEVNSENLGMKVGGIAGYNYAQIINCKNSAKITFVYTSYKGGFIDCQGTAGIVGHNAKSGLISDCLNLSDISGCACTGGVAGYNTGSIYNCGNRGAIFGSGSYVGGINGLMGGGGVISNSYNMGNVVAKYAGEGSLVGYQCGKIFNCYSGTKQPIRGGSEGSISLQYIYWNSDSLTAKESQTSFLLSFKEAEYSQGYDWTLSSEVLGTTDLLTALNNWVIQQDTSIYSGWKVVDARTNKGYPILEFGYNPIDQYDTITVDTLLNLCTKTNYGGKQYTVNDEGTVQPVVIGDKYYTNPTLYIKDPDFSKVKVHRPSLICASDTIKLYAEGAEAYCWKWNLDTISVSDVAELVLQKDSRIQLISKIDGCSRTFNTDVKLNRDSILVEMGGWGDVIAVKNVNSLFSSYQWYRDGELLEDEMGQFYYEPGGLSPGLYSVDIFDTLGNLVPICPLLIERESVKSSIQNLSIYPNPSLAMQPTYVDVGDNFLDGTVLVVSDEAGMEILRKNVYSRFSEIKLSSGYYVVSVYLSDKRILSDKILVK